MCLAVPGKIVAIHGGVDELRMGRIDFQGSRVDASLLLTPEAKVGDWVLVHAGFAIRLLDEREAFETWEYLRECNLTNHGTDAHGESGETVADEGERR